MSKEFTAWEQEMNPNKFSEKKMIEFADWVGLTYAKTNNLAKWRSQFVEEKELTTLELLQLFIQHKKVKSYTHLSIDYGKSHK